jgi:hypothetical protein
MIKKITKGLAVFLSSLALASNAQEEVKNESELQKKIETSMAGIILGVPESDFERENPTPAIKKYVFNGKINSKPYKIILDFKNRKPFLFSYAGDIGDGSGREVVILDLFDNGIGLSRGDAYSEHPDNPESKPKNSPNEIYERILLRICKEHNLYK